MKNPNSNFFTNSNLIPNVNPKPIPQQQDNGLEDYDDSCPKCLKPLSKHTGSKRMKCALARARGF